MADKEKEEKGKEEINIEEMKTAKITEKYSKKSFFHIDKKMLRFKLHFFLFEGGTASVGPFVPVLAKNVLGLSATSLAVVMTSQQLITIFVKPVIGYIADYFKRFQLMINVLLIVQTIFLFLILAIPPLNKSTPLEPLSLFYNSTEFVTLKIHSIQNNNCIIDTTLSTNLNENKTKLNNEDNTLIDAICILQINTAKLMCSQKMENEDMTQLKFETELNCCMATCTENFTDITQLYSTTINCGEISKDHSYYDIHENKTLPCKVMLSKDSDYQLTLPTPTTVSDFEFLEFWMFAVVKTIAGICVSSIFTLSNTVCSESVQKLGGEFGRQTLFGAIGWGAMAAISGIVCDLSGGFLASWILMGVLQIIAVWNISQLDLAKPHFSKNLLKDIGRVLKSIEFTAFGLGVFFNGIGAGLVWFYLIWFLAGLGASKFLCGLTQYVECFVGEIPFMFFANWFIQKLGHFNLISLSLLSYALRFLWYSYLKNPWLVLPAEVTHGFTYGTLIPTIASYGKLSAKPGTEATTLSVLFMAHGSLGAGLGCILAGIFFDRIGPHQTFFYFFILCSAAAIFNIAITFYFRRRNAKKVKITLPTS